MGILRKEFTEVMMSILPIVLVIGLLAVFYLHIPKDELIMFILCIVLVIVGFTMFLTGVEIGINPMGSSIGHEIPKRKSKTFMVVVIFAISFLVTVAEPDVSVFATQVHSLYSSINVTTLTYAIAAGVALFLILAAFRIIYRQSLRLMITIGYVIVIALTLYLYFTGKMEFLGIAFDSGGVTTGPVTVPVLLALGIGICSVGARHNKLDGFGMIGLASIGPIIALLIMGLMTSSDMNEVSSDVSAVTMNFDLLIEELKESTISVLKALVPLLLFFAFFQKIFLKYSWNAVSEMINGILFAGVGVVIFLTGVYTGFMPIATALGKELINTDNIWIILLGLLLGFLVAFAEPAVSILGKQVEDSSKGLLPKKLIVFVISIGVAVFVAIGMIKILFNINIVLIVVPFYILTLVLMWIGDKDIVGIAFDAGGVSTGPMSVSILSSIYVGISSVMYSGGDSIINGFGLIALIALAPCLFLSGLGVFLKYKKQSGDYHVQ